MDFSNQEINTYATQVARRSLKDLDPLDQAWIEDVAVELVNDWTRKINDRLRVGVHSTSIPKVFEFATEIVATAHRLNELRQPIEVGPVGIEESVS